MRTEEMLVKVCIEILELQINQLHNLNVSPVLN